jgi:hypothetical protein
LGQYIQNNSINTYTEFEKYEKVKEKTKADLAQAQLEAGKKQNETNVSLFGLQGLGMISTIMLKKSLPPSGNGTPSV